MRFAKWFDRQRKQEGLTQQAFASEVGITQGRVAQLLKGDLPSMQLAFRITHATDGEVEPNDFFPQSDAAE